MSREERAGFLLRYARAFAERVEQITEDTRLTHRKLLRTVSEIRKGMYRGRKVKEAETIADLEAEAEWWGYRPHEDSDASAFCGEEAPP